MTLVNPAYETALELKQLLMDEDLICSQTADAEDQYRFFVSDLADKFTRFATAILPDQVKETKQINIEEY